MRWRSAASRSPRALLARDDFAEAATRALDFIRKTLWRDGRLLATYKDGRAHLNAYLDDYVYLADAILELQQVRFRADELAFARELLDVTLAHFEDPAGGGFFFTSDDHEALIHRIKALATMPFLPATASPRSCSSAWATCSANRATSLLRTAPCALRGRCWRSIRRLPSRC